MLELLSIATSIISRVCHVQVIILHLLCKLLLLHVLCCLVYILQATSTIATYCTYACTVQVIYTYTMYVYMYCTSDMYMYMYLL